MIKCKKVFLNTFLWLVVLRVTRNSWKWLKGFLNGKCLDQTNFKCSFSYSIIFTKTWKRIQCLYWIFLSRAWSSFRISTDSLRPSLSTPATESVNSLAEYSKIFPHFRNSICQNQRKHWMNNESKYWEIQPVLALNNIPYLNFLKT